MNSIRKRTSRIRAELRNKMARQSISREMYLKNRIKQEKENETMMEMWNYYLNFTRLEFE
jgi:hypothetical protein